MDIQKSCKTRLPRNREKVFRDPADSSRRKPPHPEEPGIFFGAKIRSTFQSETFCRKNLTLRGKRPNLGRQTTHSPTVRFQNVVLTKLDISTFLSTRTVAGRRRRCGTRRDRQRRSPSSRQSFRRQSSVRKLRSM